MYVIAAVDQNWAIGKGGDQLCYLPADLRRFQALTTGHPVILGRKTLATFPGGRPLKNRRNLILSRDPAFAPEGAEVFRSLEALRAAAPADSFVIGGASVYAALLDGCDTAYITKIGKAWEGADAFFPAQFLRRYSISVWNRFTRNHFQSRPSYSFRYAASSCSSAALYMTSR